MLFALLALFVGGLLMAAAFTAANGDIKLTRKSTLQSKAYYAALAGVQRYQYQLTHNPNYWVECKSLGTEPVGTGVKVPSTTDEEYYVRTLGSANSTSGCVAGKQLTTLETTGSAKGTFRILSIGTAGTGTSAVRRSIVATFAHPGFTKYVYESNYEVEDPSNFSPEPTECEHYYEYRSTHENAEHKKLTAACPAIQFAPEDKVNGPMHTNDAAAICSSGGQAPTFGRSLEDTIEMNGGYYAAGGCGETPNMVGKYTTEAGSLLPPETDAELLEAAGRKFSGRTELVLKEGTPNTITWTNKGSTGTESFPTNGVIYVENSAGGCSIAKYTPFNSDTVKDTGCGNVYVKGAYTESLTIASANDVIVNGSLTTTSSATSTPPGEPTGGATLGLIAENFVRVYHAVEQEYEVPFYKPYIAAGFVPAKNETCLPASYKGKINNATTVTGLTSTEGITETGGGNVIEVSGTGIKAGTKLVETNKTAKTLVLSKSTEGGSKEVTLTFTVPAGMAYNKTLKKCVEKPKTGYVFHEAALEDAEPCNEFKKVEEEYLGGGECEYENSSKGCDAPNATTATDPNKWGVLQEPMIDAAILSTNHSWIVDNYKCGALLGKLTVWGSIAQFWRGPVGTAGGSGYIKNYNYDERLANQQPPSFLSPTSTSWKLSRETAPPTNFKEK